MVDNKKNTRSVRPADGLRGTIHVPADKSIAQRSALFAGIAEGTSRIEGYPSSADPQSALSCLRQLGIQIEMEEDVLIVHGKGIRGFSAPSEPIDCGNSGTTLRLLSGLLAGQNFQSTLIGDDSLSSRPMGRILDPLRQMNARVDSVEGHAPLTVGGASGPLDAIEYTLPVASAQVKSCVLLAGLYADSVTTVVETLPSRDHTERMLGLDTEIQKGKRLIHIRGGMTIAPRNWTIPSDFSAASFFVVAACIVPGSVLKMPNVGLNPTRTGLLEVLRAMGARIEIENRREISSEPVGDITVHASHLAGVTVARDIIPTLIDEIPILCVAAIQATGRTEIRDAGELRHKETDRIDAMVKGLRALGAEVEEFEDGLAIEGPQQLHGGLVSAFDDHRIAMSMAIAALMASDPVHLSGADSVAVSFPDFFQTLDAVRLTPN